MKDALGCLAISVLLGLSACGGTADVLSDIDVFIGTAAPGNVTPAACVPFGMVQAGPDTGLGDWEHVTGYQYGDRKIVGFSQTHLSGVGCPDMGDVSLMPFCGEYSEPLWSAFDKKDERAGPGWYEVRLKRGGIRVSVTATPHVALYALDFGQAEAGRVCLNLPFSLSYPQNEYWAHCEWKSSSVRQSDDRTITGSYRRKVWSDRRVGFVVRFDHPIARVREIPATEGVAPSRYILDFALRPQEGLKVKVALSAKDEFAAQSNLCAEASGWDFACARRSAEDRWRELLSRVSVEGSTAERRVFRTALYRLFVQPNLISDAGEPPRYSTFSCWDTFRAVHPLYTLLVPERVHEFVESLLKQGARTGYLPIWPLWGDENQCMIATHSVPIVVDAFLKGLWRGNPTNAFERIRETLTKRHEGRNKEQWDVLDRFGYYPFDVISGESVSRTLECSYDDWCAARMAAALGLREDARFFVRRAENWKNVIDPETGMARGRDTSGRWRTPFDPYALGHGGGTGNDFTEGNAWHYTWHVLQDPEGLVARLGGKAKFCDRLQALFQADPRDGDRGAQRNVSGMIGQYAHGNEPCHHVAYLFQYADRPDLTARYVREVRERFYSDGPAGLCGNEDCGQMSAWYVFSALGFYPVNPCGGEYVLGRPVFPSLTVKLPSGRVLAVRVNEDVRKGTGPCEVRWQGKRLDGFRVRHEAIVSGGELSFGSD